ncbi:MAG: serine hydrolase [Candidatus Omnitrophota bacterium]|jgi:D-alanyl-D-alanine carboxypeptidase
MKANSFLKAARGVFSFLVIAGLVAGCARQEAPESISVNAGSAVITDARKDETLFSKNAGVKHPPASTAKVMTAIVAIENSSLGRRTSPSKRAVSVEPTVAGLKPGVKYSVKDLIAAILIKSANDAAITLAEGVSGSEEEFVKLMNKKARELGMADTYFANSSGLPTGKKDSNYTTARDLTKMMRYALRYRVITRLMSKKTAVIYGSDGKKIFLKTHNKALLRNPRAPWGKTGYTHEARRTFVGINPSMRPCIIIAVLKSDRLWSDITELEKRGMEIYTRRQWGPVSWLIEWIKKQRQKAQNRYNV